MNITIDLLKTRDQIEIAIHKRCTLIFDIIKEKSFSYTKKLHAELQSNIGYAPFWFHPFELDSSHWVVYMDHYTIHGTADKFSITSSRPNGDSNEYYTEEFNIAFLLMEEIDLERCIVTWMDIRYDMILKQINEKIRLDKINKEQNEKKEYERLAALYGSKNC